MTTRMDESDRADVVANFDEAADVFTQWCPDGIIRLPAPREGVVMVEVDLTSFLHIMRVLTHVDDTD